VARIALIAPTTPYLVKSESNPEGVEGAFFEATRASWRQDFPKWVADNVKPFFTPETSPALIDWATAMINRTPIQVAIACNKMLVETDFRADCKAVTVPTLVVHGTADASAPIALTGARTAALIEHAQYRVYDGAPHGVMFTHRERLNADLEAFIRGA
jgi:pimeloyl-ACP methyl ester carboxylesterase